MKVLYPILCMLLWCFSAGAQKTSANYFKKGVEYLKNNELDSALSAYRYIAVHYPEEQEYGAAVYNIGYIYYVQKKFDKAITVFKSMLTGKRDEWKTSSGNVVSPSDGNNQFYACQMMIKMYMERKQYDRALHYLALSDTVYSLVLYCGNAQAAYQINMVMRYANIYELQHKPDKAISILLPEVFNALADNTDVIKELEKLLKDKSDVKAKLDESLTAIYPKVKRFGNAADTAYYFQFMGAEIMTPVSLRDVEQEYNEQMTLARIKESAFYKMEEQL